MTDVVGQVREAAPKQSTVKDADVEFWLEICRFIHSLGDVVEYLVCPFCGDWSVDGMTYSEAQRLTSSKGVSVGQPVAYNGNFSGL